MLKWSDLKRSSDVILAIWPQYRPLNQRWYMEELLYRGDKAPTWRDRIVPREDDAPFADTYLNREAAIASATDLNPSLRAAMSALSLDAMNRRSLELKVDKLLQAKQRLQDEEALMLSEAVRRHAQDRRLSEKELHLHADAECYRQELAEMLAAMPYLRVAQVGRSTNRWANLLLYLGDDGVWSKPYHAGNKAAQIAERAKIANGFGMGAREHWGQVKAKIRALLLPRANQLLQLASVQRMLAEALTKGQFVLVSNGIVFWYESDGEIGWRVKETAATKDTEGETIWKEGTIISKNHGRLVVLPYIKDSGEHVSGHTKNAPRDGKALPRHPDHYVEVPFSLYDGDLMIGLFGELPYE